MLKKEQQSNKVLFEGKSLARIPYSDRPLPQGGEVKYLTIEEFEKKFNFTYTESVFGNKEEFKLYSYETPPNLFPSSITPAVIKHRMQNPLDCFVLCNMGPTGHGLFTTKKLEEYTVLFVYAGEVRDATPDEGEYDYGIKIAGNLPPRAITAKQKGGLSRFMQHLPIDNEKYKKELKAYISKQINAELLQAGNISLDDYADEFIRDYHIDHELPNKVFRKQSIRDRVQESNVTLTQVTLNGMPIIVCWTEPGIEANKQVGFCYGEQYWNIVGKQPRYYKEDGRLIPLSDYLHTPSAALLKNVNPLSLYNEGVKFQNDKKYELALTSFGRALFEFRKQKGKNSPECGNCYGALASTCRDIHDYPNALKACENAIVIWSSLKENEKLLSIRKKYQDCLKLAAPNLRALYAAATKRYNKKHYLVAIDQLMFICSATKDLDLKAFSYSTLASCYRELKDFDAAIANCQKALNIRKEMKNAKAIEVVEKKLAGILEQKGKESIAQQNPV